MRRCLVAAAVLAVALTANGPADAAKGLVGKWRAHAMKRGDKTQTMPKEMKVTVEFVKDGTFIGTMEAKIPNRPPRKKVERGTWKVKGDTLTTTAGKKKKTETMKFKVKGKTLTLTKPDRGETLVLKRVR